MQMAPDAESPAQWMGYVSLADIDASVAKAQSPGGRVWVPAMDISTIGRVAVLADPDGATFAMIQELQSTPEGPPQGGDFSWFELATRDTRKALDFYGALFGWSAGDAMDMGEQETLTLLPCRPAFVIRVTRNCRDFAARFEPRRAALLA